jgi:hypothetical protein
MLTLSRNLPCNKLNGIILILGSFWRGRGTSLTILITLLETPNTYNGKYMPNFFQ